MNRYVIMDHVRMLPRILLSPYTIIGIILFYLANCWFVHHAFRRAKNLCSISFWAFIPFLNLFVITVKICKFSMLYFILSMLLFPVFIGYCMQLLVAMELAKAFKHSKYFGFWFLGIFFPIGLSYVAYCDNYLDITDKGETIAPTLNDIQRRRSSEITTAASCVTKSNQSEV
eukprot:206077_1